MSTLTVAQVIAILQTLPQDAHCHSEGCDCYGDIHTIYRHKEKNEIMFGREVGKGAFDIFSCDAEDYVNVPSVSPSVEAQKS